MKNKMKIKERYRYLATPDAIQLLIQIQNTEFEPLNVDQIEEDNIYKSQYDLEIKGLLVTSEDESEFLNYVGYTATSYEYIRHRIDELMGYSVKDINIYINSPGGYVAGIEKVIRKMETLKNHKKIHVYTDGMIASAAYWIASVSNDITATSFSQIGSIGAYTTMVDLSGAYEKEGIKIHMISSGSLKGVGEPGIEISKEQILAEQEIINAIADKFYKSVEKYRYISKEYKTGGIYLADEALQMGLIEKISDDDTITNIEETIKMSKKSNKIEAKAKDLLSAEEMEDEEDDNETPDSSSEDNAEEDEDMVEDEEELEDEEEDEVEEEKARCLALIEAFAFSPDFAKQMIAEGVSLNDAKVIAYDNGIRAGADVGVPKIENTITGISATEEYSNDHPMLAKARRMAKDKGIPLYKAMEILNKKNPAEMSDYIFRG